MRAIKPLLGIVATAILVSPFAPGCNSGGGGGGGGPTAPPNLTSVSGRVISAGTGGGLGGMIVSGGGQTTTTSPNGEYTLGGLSQPSVTLRVSGPRYPAVEITTNGAQQDFRMLRNECNHSRCDYSPSGCNEELPMFRLPFDGTETVNAVFDHTTPFFDQPDGQMVSFCGTTEQYDGHSGWDFGLSRGTAVLAAAGGEVVFAGREDPFFCRFLDRQVAGKWVAISHTSPFGEELITLYGHFQEIQVSEGDTVGMGSQLGLSGNTGCSTGPHLHFEVLRRLPGPENSGVDDIFSVDPFGWQGMGRDPWAVDTNGAASAWMFLGSAVGASGWGEPTHDMHNPSLRTRVLKRPRAR